MTKKRNLTTFMIAIMIMLFSLPVNAEGIKGYAQWDELNTTLTFYGEGSVYGDAYELNTDQENPKWCDFGITGSVTTVVFDDSFKDVRPTSCYKWFSGFGLLTTIQGIENLNTEEVTNMSYMFNSCQGLTSLDLSNFNTAKVTDMSYMFNGCSGLTSLGLSSFNTAEVENMSYMFQFCQGLTSLDLSSFNTTEVSDMYAMFFVCSGLTSLDLSSFNTEEVTNIGYMFGGCSGLTSHDLSSFNTAKVTNMSYMFDTCESLTTIYASDDFKIGDNTSGLDMFSNCASLKGKASYSKDNTGIEMANYNTGYFTESNLTPYVKWDASTKVLTFKVANTKEAGSGVYDLNEDATAPGWLENNNCEKVIFTPSFIHAKPTSCYRWFFNFLQLTKIEGIEYLNTEKVTNMRYMLNNCRELTSLDLSSFNTANVTYMSYMFSGCSGLSSLDLSSFKTANVTNMNYMFNGCSGLTSLDLSSFNTSKVTNMEGMFGGCSGLTSLDLSSFNTANVEYMDEMFNNCQDLTTICVSDNFSIGNVTYDSDMFSGCSQLVGAVAYNPNKTDHTMANYTSGYFTKSNLTPYVKWNKDTKVLTFKVAHYIEGNEGEWKFNEGAKDPGWSIDEVKNYCTKVVFTSSFNHAKPTSCYLWFYGFSNLTTIQGIENLNTEEVKNMRYMFSDCPNLRSLTLSSFFNTANVTDMSSMFRGCSSLTSLDLSKFNTDKVENMSSMFNGCSDLENLTLSSFNTDKVTDMSAMFGSCQKLTSLDLSKFNTANVTTMYQLFYDCSGLTSLDLSSFNTANVTNMNNMFYGCRGLTALDLSSFNTANVTDMSCMFCWCSRLTSLALSSFNTANVEYMSYMFYGCSGLNSLNLSSFKTANVTNMNYMFNGCSGLTKIYVSDDFATGNVTYGSNMFTGCSKLVGAIGYDSGKTSKEYANYNTGYFKTYFTLGEKKVELFGEQLTTESLDLSGDNDFVAHAPFTANTAKYSRVLSSSGSTWFSLCLPFAYTPNNFTAYQLNGATEKAVEIEEITETIAAGTPVLFKFKDGEKKEINITALDANILKAPVDVPAVNGDGGSSLQLCGTYQTKTFSKDADGNAFILLKDKLMNPAKMMLENQNVTTVGVKPFRAYMTLTASAQTSSARAFSIGRGDEGNEGTTAIDLLNSVATDDAEYYDINGRRIDAPVKGVNIVRRGNKTIKLIIK